MLMQKWYYLPIIFIIVFIPLTVNAMERNVELIEFRNIADYILFENKMKQQLGIPIIATDFKTGELRPNAQITTDYTKPIFHDNKTDARIVVYIDEHADRTNQSIINKTEAIQKGWVLDEGVP